MNIEPTILRKKIEDLRLVGAFRVGLREDHPFVHQALPRGKPDSQSRRRATSGSMRDACRAGTYAARRAAVSSVITPSVSARGSFGVMPYRNEATNFDVASAAAIPTSSPAATSTTTSRRTIRTTP